jgi:hypothetical protein
MIKEKYDCQIIYKNDDSLMFEENKELFSETTIIIQGFQFPDAYIKVK